MMAIRKDHLDKKTAKAYEDWRAEFSVQDLLKYTEVTKTYPLKDLIQELDEMEEQRVKKVSAKGKKKK